MWRQRPFVSETGQDLRLRDMLQACNDVEEHTDGLTREQFLATKAVYQAVLWNLTVLGEAANHLPESTIETRLDIPWGAIIGMRNRLVHGYWSIDPLIVWEVVHSAIPTLIPQLEALLSETTQEEADG